MMRARIYIFLLVLCFSFAACAPQTPTATPAPPPPPKFDARVAMPCDIFTRAEAEQLLGKRVNVTTMGSVEDLAQAEFVTCAYLTQEARPSGIALTLFGRHNAETARTLFQDTKAESTAQNKFTAVDGLGDEAFWNGSMLFVRRGEQIIGIMGARSLSENDLGMVKQVAEKVLARIQ